jgi:hypothetical protein
MQPCLCSKLCSQSGIITLILPCLFSSYHGNMKKSCTVDAMCVCVKSPWRQKLLMGGMAQRTCAVK